MPSKYLLIILFVSVSSFGQSNRTENQTVFAYDEPMSQIEVGIQIDVLQSFTIPSDRPVYFQFGKIRQIDEVSRSSIFCKATAFDYEFRRINLTVAKPFIISNVVHSHLNNKNSELILTNEMDQHLILTCSSSKEMSLGELKGTLKDHLNINVKF